jgi:hypothetical protein
LAPTALHKSKKNIYADEFSNCFSDISVIQICYTCFEFKIFTSEESDPYDWESLKAKDGTALSFDTSLNDEKITSDIILHDTLEAQYVLILVQAFSIIPSAKINWFTLDKAEVSFKNKFIIFYRKARGRQKTHLMTFLFRLLFFFK